jgi:pimeloyl-ACP methyl ester carboxylesterase
MVNTNMKSFFYVLLILLSLSGFSQAVCKPDSTGNNLVHITGYKTSTYGEILKYKKSGKGVKTLILIPGLGFDASVFDDFVKANKDKYTMYVITIPGYGKTQAPPMPTADTSFGKQYWNKGVIEGVLKLMAKEKIEKPIIVGHFTQGTQLAMRMAIDYSDKVSGVIILGGPAKFIVVDKDGPKQYPLQGMISYIDKYTAPGWFRIISKKTFDNGNYLPEVYSLDKATGNKLWKQVASVPLPVMVRYLCEFLASDITLEFEKIKCPVLVFRSKFNDEVLNNTTNNYILPQFIDAWNSATDKNALIKVIDVSNASTFVWKDKPDEIYKEVNRFISNNN